MPPARRCWSILPRHNVLDLRRGTKKGSGLLDTGVTLLRDIPDDFKLTTHQAIQRKTANSGRPHIKERAISNFLHRLKYPIHFLDFETMGTAIPLFDSVRPYQQILFQFSLHIVREPGAKPEHTMFLAEGYHDPRPKFMLGLREAIGRTREAMPNFSPWRKAVQARVVDLLHPFKSFAYYHPDQRGSDSMKTVLPALTGKGYGSLAIQDGGMACREFLQVNFAEWTRRSASGCDGNWSNISARTPRG